MTEIVFPEGSTDYVQDGNVIYNAAGDKVIYAIKQLATTELVIPANVTSIGNYAYKSQGNITKVYIPDRVQTIGNFAFFSNLKLEEVFIYKTKDDGTGKFVADLDENGEYQSPLINNLKSIGQSAFVNCQSLKVFDIPDSVATIGTEAFVNCTSFGSTATEDKPFILPSSIKSYGYGAFRNTGLNYVKFEGDFSSVAIGGYLFGYTSSLKKVDLNTQETHITKIPDYMFYGSAISQIDLTGIATIGNSAFYYSGLTSVTIPSGVTSIALYAFAYSYNLTKATFQNNASLRALPNGLFSNCGSLTEVENLDGLPNLTHLGMYTFEYTGLKSFVIPETIEHLTDKADTPAVANKIVYTFFRCYELEKVVLPSRLQTMGASVFQYCDKLTDVYYNGYVGTGAVMPSSLRVLGNNALGGTGIRTADFSRMPASAVFGTLFMQDCVNLTSAKFNDSITTFGNNTFKGAKSLREFDFRDYPLVTKTSEGMFYESGIETVTISDSITEIKSSTFRDSTLKNIVMSSSVTAIGTSAFANSALTSIDLSSVTKFDDAVFEGCEKLSGVTFNDSLTALSGRMFEMCKSLIQVKLPASLKTIGKGTFGYSGLQSVAITELVEKIDGNAFYNCESLTSVIFKGGAVSLIETQAFAECVMLEDLELPQGLVNIGNYAFLNTKIKTVYIPTTLSKIGVGAFGGCTEINEFIVSQDNPVFKTNDDGLLLDAGGKLVAYPWGKKTLDLTGVEVISEGQFVGTTVTDLVIPNTVREIGFYAFAYSKHLKTVTFEEGSKLTSIGQFSFQYTPALETVDLTNATSLTAIEDRAFERSGLMSIVLPETVKSIGISSFSYCDRLTSVIIKGEVQTGINTFMFSKALETVVFEKPIASLETNLFNGCSSLKNVVLPEGLTLIGQAVFANSGLTEFTLPKTVERIEYYAFKDCKNLATFNIPEDAKLYSLGNSAFENSGLKSIKLPASLKEINQAAFSGCTQLETIEFAEPTENLLIETYVFRGCTSATIYIPKKVTLNAARVFEGWTAEQTIYVIDRSEIDVMEDWYGMFTDLLTYAWYSDAAANVVWNYAMP